MRIHPDVKTNRTIGFDNAYQYAESSDGLPLKHDNQIVHRLARRRRALHRRVTGRDRQIASVANTATAQQILASGLIKLNENVTIRSAMQFTNNLSHRVEHR